MVFFVSAVFHEVLVGVPLHMLRLWAFWGLMMQVGGWLRSPLQPAARRWDAWKLPAAGLCPWPARVVKPHQPAAAMKPHAPTLPPHLRHHQPPRQPCMRRCR